jgi:ppGpp synthetase/RelA/SpoT-type nucleotidyltranferase
MPPKRKRKISRPKKIQKVFSANELLPKKEFLERYKIKKESFEKTGLTWSELTSIFENYLALKSKLEYPAKAIVDILFSKEARDIGVHSVRYRIKDANGLIEKIIRKRIKEPEREITLENYKEEITDVIGIRALHVFKNDILGIHHFIMNSFSLKDGEEPIQYHREGDEKDFLDMCKCFCTKQEKHDKGYRSFHYIVATNLTKEKYFAEIQVRTIFEEGWSEIDHKIRYSFKNYSSSPFDYELRTLNGIAGNADEIGSNIKRLEQKEQEKMLSPKIKRKRK